jgi:poly(glycerol-phosphate) alpha-glucosyltransferase
MINTANLVGSISRKAGGLHDSVRRLVQCLASHGVGVQVLTLQDEFTENDIHLWDPVHVDAFVFAKPRSFGYARGFLSKLNQYSPDLVHTYGIWQYTSIATTKYCSRFRVPYMISPHGMLDPWAVNHHRWRKAIAYAMYEHQHLRGAACLRALCESEASSMRKLGLRNPIAVIPNGIDLPDEGTNQIAIQQNPFSCVNRNDDPRKILLYLGRIHPKKGLVNLLNAWKIMLSKTRTARRHEWILAIAGWDQGGHESDLKRLASDLEISWTDNRDGQGDTHGLEAETAAQERRPPSSGNRKAPSVVFMGPQFGMDKASCYANCDAFVLPSFSEGLPMVILEAWAYGKPVIMTPECNLPEGFAANAALRVETNTQNIAQCLSSLTEMDEEELQSIGNYGRDLVVQRFTWSSIANQLKTTYDWMIGGTPRPTWTLEN